MAILQSTLDQLRARLEAALQTSVPRAEPWVALTNPVDLDGRVVESARNKMLMVLVGLQNDPASGVAPTTNVAAPLRATPPLHLDASVMLMANFSGSEYATGLGMLSRTIAYFHENPVLIADPLPGQPAENIVLDFVNLDLAQTNELMAMLDLKYLPSAVYRMRGLEFTSSPPALSEPR